MKKTGVGAFILKFSILSAIIFGLVAVSGLFIETTLFHIFLYNTIFMYLISLISGIVQVYTASKAHFQFMASMSGSMILKILLSVGFIYLLVLHFEGYVVAIVLSFFVAYLLFTIFEVYHLLYNLRPHFKSNKAREKQ